MTYQTTKLILYWYLLLPPDGVWSYTGSLFFTKWTSSIIKIKIHFFKYLGFILTHHLTPVWLVNPIKTCTYFITLKGLKPSRELFYYFRGYVRLILSRKRKVSKHFTNSFSNLCHVLFARPLHELGWTWSQTSCWDLCSPSNLIPTSGKEDISGFCASKLPGWLVFF